MPTLRMRVTGSEDDTRAMMNLLQSLDGIEHVEEVGDLMPHMDDADSSSAGLSENTISPDAHEIEIEAPNALVAEHVRDVAAEAAEDLGVTVEFVDEF